MTGKEYVPRRGKKAVLPTARKRKARLQRTERLAIVEQAAVFLVLGWCGELPLNDAIYMADRLLVRLLNDSVPMVVHPDYRPSRRRGDSAT